MILRLGLILLSFSLLSPREPFEIDFGLEKGGKRWGVTNDTVMGGRSSGKAKLTENTVSYTGSISLENNGGFSSFKSPYARIDLTDYEYLEMRVKSKGSTFAFTLEMSTRFYRPYYKQLVETESDDWETIKLKMSDFKLYRMSRTNGQSLTAEDAARLIRIGFISDDKREIDFDLEIDYIKFY
ncbi:MAG: CIA30 family protein [Roseivirga sp.]